MAHRIFSTPTLRRQFLVPLIFIVFSVLAMVGMVAIKITQDVIRNHTVHFGDRMLSQAAHRLGTLVDGAQVTVDSLILDRRLAPLLQDLSSSEPRRKAKAEEGLYNLLMHYKTLLPGAELVVLDDLGNAVSTFDSQSVLEDVLPETFGEDLKVWRLRSIPYFNRANPMLSFRTLELTAKIINLPWQSQSGWIILYLDYRLVESIMTNISLQENTANQFLSDAVVYGPDLQVIFPWIYFYNPILEQACQKLSGQFRSTEYTELSVEGEEHLIIASRIPSTPWKIFISAPTRKLYAGLDQIYHSIFLIGSVCTVIAVFSVTLLSFFVTKPVEDLRRVMQLVEEGDLSARAPEDGPLEIRALGRAFNRMLEEVDMLTKRLVNEESIRKTAMVKALQAQIAPHFLFNTLTALAGMAIKRPPPEVAEALRSLRRLLYLSIGKDGDFLRLSEEFEYIHHYMYLMSIRYPGKFRLQLELPEELRNCRIIRLVLQPLVENALQHGLKFQAGIIKLSAAQEGGNLLIEVTDDGEGLSSEELNEVWKREKNQSGIGIRNVDERLKLTFGSDYGLRLISKKGEGTSALLRLPIQYFEEKQVESGPEESRPKEGIE